MQLSTKDVTYLRDQMSWSLLMAKKCNHYAQQCQDTQLAQLCQQVGQTHQAHYDMFLNQLTNLASQAGIQGGGQQA